LISSDGDLTKAIYCEPSTIASRIITNAQFELKHYRLITFEDQFSLICDRARENTLSHYISYIFQFALQRDNELSEQDKLVLLLLADFSLTLKVSQTLEIYMNLQDTFPEIAYLSSTIEEGKEFKPSAREKCPVCDELVNAIGSGTMAQCAAGHLWGKFMKIYIYIRIFILNQP
jgi:hypothetical protein